MGTKNKKRKSDEDSKDESCKQAYDNAPVSPDDSSSITYSEAASDHRKVSRKRKKHAGAAIGNQPVAESMEAHTPLEYTETQETSRVVGNETAQNKSYRKRKKHYYNGLRAQMEFYFGDANLSKDRFLKQLIDKDPYVPLKIFLTFNKMKVLTSRVEDIAKSLTTSQLLELDESQQKVKRKIPLVEKRNVDEKTIYVEALPSSADHEWVRQIFERFGKVDYISLPKYAKSHKIKEFGFVEFEKEESVGKAIEAFKEFNGVLCMQEKDPSELVSVKSYIKENTGDDSVVSDLTQCDLRKRPKIETQDEAEPVAKKFKPDSQDEEVSSNIEGNTSQSEPEEAGAVAKNKDDMEEDERKKKRRKRKKKSKSEEKLKRKAELNTDVSYYELKILPKRDWKRLRNKYLNLQREKVAELKRKAWKEQQESKQHCKDLTKDESCSQLPEKDQKKKSKESKHKLQKMNMNFYGAAAEESQVKTPTSEKPQHNPLERPPLFTYEEGLIVEMSFLEPCVNIKEYKADMRQYGSVKYVDIKEGSMQAYLRLESPEKAKEFVQNISCAEYQCKILIGDAESTYWRKIESDREQKLNKQVKVPQKRGREKVKKLISKHIRFGDDDDD
uniref:Uncharacterized protein n=1 Tax=Stomoxys calcitrans TaxID=35570 RepID=A0A1I8PJM9_STOCA